MPGKTGPNPTIRQNMKRILLYITMAAMLASCGDDSPEAPGREEIVPENVTRTVLVYAVNQSSLRYDFNDDRAEMLEALKDIDLTRHQLLVYNADSEGSCALYRSVRDLKNNTVTLEPVTNYDGSRLSTDPRRIGEVVDDALSLYPESEYDLVFWGHGMSWYPYFTGHEVHDTPSLYSYGGEYVEPGSTQTDWTEIDELADAVPSGRFDTIWFDCCYMSGIEVIYQFRDKCSTFVGYPTEVWQYGLPYDRVLPYLLNDRHDVTGAARAFYSYYAASSDPVTVAVTDMAAVERVADVSSRIIASGDRRPSRGSLLNYSRSSYAPFYDFRQFMTETARANGRDDLAAEFSTAMESMVTWHAETDKNFNLRPWNTENISGVSTHYYTGSQTQQEQYYTTLDWFKRVY